MKRRLHAAMVALLVAPWLSACQKQSEAGSSTPPAAGKVGYPGTLRPPSELGPNVQWEQRVQAHYGDSVRSFDAVLSKADDELLLIVLSPMKTPGIVVRLADGEVEVDNRSPQPIPFDPRYMMLDVQRVYFPWIPGDPPADGERRHETNGEVVIETYADGHLEQRRFRRLDARPPGEIVIDYRGWQPGADAPRHAALQNGWFDYALTIETLVQQRL